MSTAKFKYGIVGQQAPELNVPQWIGSSGQPSVPVALKDYEDKFKIIYCFQAWCQGCHSQGFPSLQKMVAALEGNDRVAFLTVQTVFEGREANTFEKVKEIQQEYELQIPFGHDVGDKDTGNISSIMYHYRTGGTPWFIFIDQEGQVVFNDFHLNPEKAIEYLQDMTQPGEG